MKISIILTTHNGRRDKCKRAIESVLAQTLSEWELVVVDDASSDGTDEMVSSFANNQIIYLRRDQNFGCDTRPKNEGILKAQAPYVAFLDSDNTWRPDHLAALVKELDADPDLTLVYGDRWLIDDEGKLSSQLGVAMDFHRGRLLEMNYIDTSDVLVRRAALQEVGGFDERYSKYVDWNLWLRLEKAGFLFKRVPLILTDYHLHSAMKSANNMTEAEKKLAEGEWRPIPDWNPFNLEIQLPYLGEVHQPRIAIFSLTYDRLEETKKCFESLYKTAGYEFDHFIVDNGSTDGTQDWLFKQYPFGKVSSAGEDRSDGRAISWWCKDRFHVLTNQKNQGISIASNQALDHIAKEKYDIIVKVDNDAFFQTDGWLKRMVEIWKTNRKIAMSVYISGLRDNPGGAPRLDYTDKILGETMGITRHLGGICVFADSSAYEGFRWDESDFLHSMQDMEFSQHLLAKGFNLCYLENYYASHGVDGTAGQEKRFPEYFQRRRKEKQTRYEEDQRSKP